MLYATHQIVRLTIFNLAFLIFSCCYPVSSVVDANENLTILKNLTGHVTPLGQNYDGI